MGHLERRSGTEHLNEFFVIARLIRFGPKNCPMEICMIRRSLCAAAFALTALIVPPTANAQGIPEGADHGARVGEHDAGPVGAVVGGVVGGVIGGVNGILGVDDRPRFHSYVVEHHYPSYEYRGDLRVGTELPEAGVTYYEVPNEYARARDYRYTIVNGHTVLVDPHTRHIVEIVD
jgi:hypothetical protein